MCGIYGEVHFDGRVDLDDSIRRLDFMRHRGPDGWGAAVGNYRSGITTVAHNRRPTTEGIPDPNFMFGHRRLTIIDLSDAALQPMSTQDEEHLLVFNGEIYNSAEIKDVLLGRGHSFRTDHSDTEVLLHAFVEWGERCLEQLRGMFAFAVYCRSAKKIFLARDRLGQKPLYFQLARDRFTFASELWPIASQPDVHFEIDRNALAQYLLLGYVPQPASILEGVLKLEPGHFAWVDLEERKISKHLYWDIDLTNRDAAPSRKQWEDLVCAELEKSVRYRLISDVPLGMFLSGGIDSTIVAKFASEALPSQVRAYNADFLQKYSEREWSEQASARYGIDMRATMIDLEAAQRHEDVIDVLDEPFDGASSTASYEMFRQARGETKVILTGDGGDELFAGYQRYHGFQKRVRLAKSLRRSGADSLLRGLGRAFGSVRRRVEDHEGLLRGEYLLHYLARRHDPNFVSLLKEPPGDWRALFGFIAPLFDTPGNTSIRSLQYLDLKTILPGRMLFKLDRFSMACSIEGRSPFMDHRLVELAYRIPERHVVDSRGGKRTLKDILQKDLGRRFVDRPKKGFGNPLRYWFRGPEADQLLATVRDPGAYIYRYLDFDRVAEWFSAIRGEYDGQPPRPLWRLVVLARYLERAQPLLTTALAADKPVSRRRRRTATPEKPAPPRYLNPSDAP